MTNELSNEQAANELKAMQEHIEPYMSVVGLTAYTMGIKALESQQRIRKIIDDFDKKHPEDIITPVHQYINDLCDVLEDIEYQIPNKAESEE